MKINYNYLKKIGNYYVFPENMDLGLIKTLETNTTIVQTANGKERRNINWSEPRFILKGSMTVQNKEMIDDLRKFFRAVMGEAYAFRIKDWSDFEIFTEDSYLHLIKETESSKEYKLGRYELYDVSLNIYPFYNENFKVFSNEELLEYDIDYSFNVDNATITLYGDKKNLTNLTYQAEFHYLVRFDGKTMDVTIKNINNFDWTNINFVEVK